MLNYTSGLQNKKIKYYIASIKVYAEGSLCARGKRDQWQEAMNDIKFHFIFPVATLDYQSS